MTRALAAVLVLPAVIGLASRAWGFARERVDPPCEPLPGDFGCAPLEWHDKGCVVIDIYRNGFTEMSREEVARALAAAAHAWSPSAVDCPTQDKPRHPYLEIVPSLAADSVVARAASDSHNVLLFRDTGWDTPELANVIALTTLTNKRDGRLVDVDIEVNTQLFHWANLDPGTAAAGSDLGAHDLQNAITHEFGHFLGLAHVCNAGTDDDTLDDKGNLVPWCDPSLPAEIVEATMFAVIGPGETKQRTLAADDVAGICAIYPPEMDPKQCALDLPDDGCGCAAAGSSDGLGLALATLALMKAAVARRSGSRRSA